MKPSCPSVRRVLPQVLAPLLLCSLAPAAIVFNENFEGPSNAFGMPTYQYTENYTLPNSLFPAGGMGYAHGGNPAGADGVDFTQDFSGPTLTLIDLGFSTGQIDDGLLAYDLSAQFSTYQSQNDYAIVTMQFRNELAEPIGSAVAIGGLDLVEALAEGGGSRAWATDSGSGYVPAGARDLVLSVSNTKIPQGAYIDGYLDNVVLDVTAVPEPAGLMTAALGFAAMLLRRRI